MENSSSIHNTLQFTPFQGREHETLRAAIPMRFTRAARRLTPVFALKNAQKHVEFGAV